MRHRSRSRSLLGSRAGGGGRGGLDIVLSKGAGIGQGMSTQGAGNSINFILLHDIRLAVSAQGTGLDKPRGPWSGDLGTGKSGLSNFPLI